MSPCLAPLTEALSSVSVGSGQSPSGAKGLGLIPALCLLTVCAWAHIYPLAFSSSVLADLFCPCFRVSFWVDRPQKILCQPVCGQKTSSHPDGDLGVRRLGRWNPRTLVLKGLCQSREGNSRSRRPSRIQRAGVAPGLLCSS